MTTSSPCFDRVNLDSEVSPFLSSVAYQFWHINDKAFSKAFYMNGYSGLALRLAQVIFSLAVVSKDANASENPGVLLERKMLLNEGGIYEFVRDTLDPIPSTHPFEGGAYFYPLLRPRVPAFMILSSTRLLPHRPLYSHVVSVLSHSRRFRQTPSRQRQGDRHIPFAHRFDRQVSAVVSVVCMRDAQS